MFERTGNIYLWNSESKGKNKSCLSHLNSCHIKSTYPVLYRMLNKIKGERNTFYFNMGNVTAGLKKWTWWDEPYLLIFMPLLASLLSALNLGSPRTCIINQWNAAEVTMQDFWVQPLRSPGSVHFHTLVNPEPSCQKSNYPYETTWTGQLKRRGPKNTWRGRKSSMSQLSLHLTATSC